MLAIAQTKDGFIWLGTTGGLLRFDGSVLERYKPEAGPLPANWVSALLATSDGGLWGRLPKRRGQLPQARHSRELCREGRYACRRIRNFAQDSNGTTWAAAVGGLGYFDGRIWHSIGKDWNPRGLPFNSPSSVVVDGRGALWVSANEGVFLLPRGASEFRQLTPGPIPGYLPTFAATRKDEMWLWVPESQSLLRFPMPALAEIALRRILLTQPERSWLIVTAVGG